MMPGRLLPMAFRSWPYTPSGMENAAILFSLHALPIAGDMRRWEAISVLMMPSSLILDSPQPSSTKSPGATPETIVRSRGVFCSLNLRLIASIT